MFMYCLNLQKFGKIRLSWHCLVCVQPSLNRISSRELKWPFGKYTQFMSHFKLRVTGTADERKRETPQWISGGVIKSLTVDSCVPLLSVLLGNMSLLNLNKVLVFRVLAMVSGRVLTSGIRLSLLSLFIFKNPQNRDILIPSSYAAPQVISACDITHCFHDVCGFLKMDSWSVSHRKKTSVSETCEYQV